VRHAGRMVFDAVLRTLCGERFVSATTTAAWTVQSHTSLVVRNRKHRPTLIAILSSNQKLTTTRHGHQSSELLVQSGSVTLDHCQRNCTAHMPKRERLRREVSLVFRFGPDE
jgi:hypothetical protein